MSAKVSDVLWRWLVACEVPAAHNASVQLKPVQYGSHEHTEPGGWTTSNLRCPAAVAVVAVVVVVVVITMPWPGGGMMVGVLLGGTIVLFLHSPCMQASGRQ